MTENSLHAGLKNYLKLTDDKIEYPVDGYIIDIVRDNTLYEIQTKNFYALKPKLFSLLDHYPIHVIYPIAQQKWIYKIADNKTAGKRRKSPKHGSIYNMFDQLVYLADFLTHPNLFIDILLIEQEDTWVNDGKGSWRRKGWSLTDQKLLKVIDEKEFTCPDDYNGLIPAGISPAFRNIDLAASAKIPISVARKLTYTLLRAGLLTQNGKSGRSNLFSLAQKNTNVTT